MTVGGIDPEADDALLYRLDPDMNVEANPEADDGLLYDLDLLAGHKLEATDHPRLAPYLEETTIWMERRCPACGRHYTRRIETCPHDGQATDQVAAFRPYLWLG